MNCRCPHCGQLYEISEETIKADSVFQCARCPETFSVDLVSLKQCVSLDPLLQQKATKSEISRGKSGDLSSLLSEPAAASVALSDAVIEACPQCQQPKNRQFDHCLKCQVIFEKLDIVRPHVKVHQSVLTAWKQVVGDYKNTEKHSYCQLQAIKHSESLWLIEKYQEMKMLFGGEDTMGDTMLAKFYMQLRAKDKVAEEPKAHSTVRSQLQIFLTRWSWSALGLVASFLVIYGMASKGHKNLIGLGVSLLCLIFGFKTFVKPRQPGHWR